MWREGGWDEKGPHTLINNAACLIALMNMVTQREVPTREYLRDSIHTTKIGSVHVSGNRVRGTSEEDISDNDGRNTEGSPCVVAIKRVRHHKIAGIEKEWKGGDERDRYHSAEKSECAPLNNVKPQPAPRQALLAASQ